MNLNTIKNIGLKLKHFWFESIRVFKITRKPSRMEFKTIVKVSGLGIAIIGAIGFLIHMAKELLRFNF